MYDQYTGYDWETEVELDMILITDFLYWFPEAEVRIKQGYWPRGD